MATSRGDVHVGEAKRGGSEIAHRSPLLVQGASLLLPDEIFAVLAVNGIFLISSMTCEFNYIGSIGRNLGNVSQEVEEFFLCYIE